MIFPVGYNDDGQPINIQLMGRAWDDDKLVGMAYAFEEIATIIEYNIKVGPPRERFYDEPARFIAGAIGNPPLSSVYLHPTFPLGVGPDLFL